MLDLCGGLKHVAIRVAKKLGSVAKGVVGGASDDAHPALPERFRATCDLARSDAECELQ